MKKTFLTSVAALAIMGFAACNNEKTEETTMSDTVNAGGVSDVSGSRVSMRQAPDPNGSYVDLKTGKPVKLKRDDNYGYVVNLETNEPVEFYVDMNLQDTFYGKTGDVVNNALTRDNAGIYELDDSKVEWDGDNMKIKNDDGSKEKLGDEEYKYKDDDVKMKSTNDETKYKSGDVKVKTTEDETKIKTPTTKIKANENGVEVKKR